MAMRAVTLSIDVANVLEAAEFDQRGLGFELKHKLAASAYALEGAGVRIFLLQRDAESSPIPNHACARTYERHWTPVHLDLEVDDLSESLSRALAAGATLESRSSSPQWGDIAMCADPFGNGFCLIRPADEAPR